MYISCIRMYKAKKFQACTDHFFKKEKLHFSMYTGFINDFRKCVCFL